MKATIKGMKELEMAVRRNPGVAREELNKFFVRGLAVYKSGIGNNPWRVDGSGGGAPVRSGNLRDNAHNERIEKYRAAITVNDGVAPYAIYVHEGTYKMQKRPWLDYTKRQKQKDIDRLAIKLLENIVKDLSK